MDGADHAGVDTGTDAHLAVNKVGAAVIGITGDQSRGEPKTIEGFNHLGRARFLGLDFYLHTVRLGQVVHYLTISTRGE